MNKENEKLLQAGSQNDADLTIEETFAGLEALLEKLEDKETSLEDSFLLYEKGMNLIRTCSRKIEQVEAKVLCMDEKGETYEF